MLLVTGLVLLGLDECFDVLPTTAALHALTVGAIGATLAVMTRASLGQTGRPLVAGLGDASNLRLCDAGGSSARPVTAHVRADDAHVVGRRRFMVSSLRLVRDPLWQGADTAPRHRA